ncbi:MAG: Rpp14/Pop5 family protein [Promethearchaeota archaeon]
MKDKERQRYVKFSIFSNRNLEISAKPLANLVWRAYSRLYGEIKSGKAGFWIIEYDIEKQEGIIRCSHLVLDELITTLTLITRIDGEPVAIDTVKSSGTIKQLLHEPASSS